MKTFLDPGQGLLWESEAQVIRLSARKRYGDWKGQPKRVWRLWRGRMVE